MICVGLGIAKYFKKKNCETRLYATVTELDFRSLYINFRDVTSH